MMPMPAITIRKNRNSTERRQVKKIKLPDLLKELLHHPLSNHVIFDQKASRFLYAHHGTNGTAKSAVGLTTLIKKCFWPDYDPWDPRIINKVRVKNRALKKLLKTQTNQNRGANGYITKTSKYFPTEVKSKYWSTNNRPTVILKKSIFVSNNQPNGDGAGGIRPPRVGDSWRNTKKRVHHQNKVHASTEDPFLASLSPKQRGVARGRMVHEQLQVYAMDQYNGTKQFTELWGSRGSTGKSPHQFTVAALGVLEEMNIQLACAELIIVNPTVPVATAIDLVGWHRPTNAPVLIEIKTGSKHRSLMGTGPMTGPSMIVGLPVKSGGLGLSNSPWNQALVQLACMHGTVESCYGIGMDPKRVPLLSLLLWIDEAEGVRTKWLHQAMHIETSPTILLNDLRRFKQAEIHHRLLKQKRQRRGRHRKRRRRY